MQPGQQKALIAAVVLFILLWVGVIAFRVVLMASDTPAGGFT